ncbi:biotin--[acetyl-CoA-carboxylase] ligase [Paludibacterium paludis]|uniref:Bifunctional ligase/repressor BirA n=1 Tax=Paludibacterium paludis TaxID=1225769 RepID=A0A918UAB9_9NEIS|nr:biotin--[acetyl-CoA-carboxylase] ligase [Paludibacterium paludis]GGY16012.1 bifunctional ligase/repressor BirA [Paludibacterium paludis]
MSPLAFDILKLLADGRFHSGEAMAGLFGCSRTLIWQAVKEIGEETGIDVFSVRGQGYRLAEAFEILDVTKIRAGLERAAGETLTVAVADQVDSTNTQLMARAASGGLHGLVLAAEVQTAGRGRLGRRWSMRPGCGLTFSVLWRFERTMSELSGLSLAVGVALARSLRRAGADVGLKWPNDVLLQDAKMAGILIELSGEANGPASVVIGVGLNLTAPGPVDQPVACLAQVGIRPSRNALLAALLNDLHNVLSEFDGKGFDALREEWLGFFAHLDCPVTLTFSHGEPVNGVARGVAVNGALQVETLRGLETFHAGEVSVRRLA